MAATSDNSVTLHTEYRFYELKLTREEINDLLLGTDNKGRTAWHLAVNWGKIETLQKEW